MKLQIALTRFSSNSNNSNKVSVCVCMYVCICVSCGIYSLLFLFHALSVRPLTHCFLPASILALQVKSC